MSNNKVSSNSRKSPSKSSSSTCSSPLPFSPSPIPNQLMTGNSIWDDINLASLQDHPNTSFSKNNDHHAFHGMMFQDFLARPSDKDTQTRVASKEPSSGGGNTFLENSLGSPQATMLSLNSGSDLFQYQESSTSNVPVRPNPQMHSHAGGGTISFDSYLDSPFDALASSFFPFSSCKKRPLENGGGTGSDRRHKRMIKNRESAARSRARKQESPSPF
ncbi:unnamed protein product [Dovyalis caffra]|uniref:BZIP domain-containing protein n=1 Tax=Dovyalis caffra TaxID=77055 RepID=A0AAV1S6J7_9ROSI|nr:unnamed protein product [Dovyalis caffra]